MKKELYERYKNLKESLEELRENRDDEELLITMWNNRLLYQKAYAETFFRGLLLNISGTGLYTVHLLHQYRKVELLLEQGISNIAFYDTFDQKSIFLILLAIVLKLSLAEVATPLSVMASAISSLPSLTD